MKDLIIILGEHRNEKAAFENGKNVSKILQERGVQIEVAENPEKRTLLEFVKDSGGKTLSVQEVDRFLYSFSHEVYRKYKLEFPFVVDFHNYNTTPIAFSKGSINPDFGNTRLSDFSPLKNSSYSENIWISPTNNNILLEMPHVQHYSISDEDLSLVKEVMDEDSFEMYSSYLTETDIGETMKNGWLGEEIVLTVADWLSYISKNRLEYFSICMQNPTNKRSLGKMYSKELEREIS